MASRLYFVPRGSGDQAPCTSAVSISKWRDQFLAGDQQALENVFRQIDEMTKTELEQGTAEMVDWFLPFCIAGLSVLGLFVLFQLGWRYTPW